MDGSKKIFAKQNTWGTDVYAYGTVDFFLEDILPAYLWHGGMFKADVTVVNIE